MHTAKQYKMLFEIINAHYSSVRKNKRTNKKFGIPLVYEFESNWYDSWFDVRALTWKKEKYIIPLIQVGKNKIPNYKKIAILAHEFGHFLSWKKDRKASTSLRLLYAKLEDGSYLTKREHRKIMREEINAWKYGLKFIHDNGFDVDKKILKMMAFALGTYSSAC